MKLPWKLCLLVWAVAAIAEATLPTSFAQPPSNSPSDTPPSTDPRRTYPTVRLIWYAGWEGYGWKESRLFELTEWTPQKDVLITASWVRPEGTSPGARAPGEGSGDPFYERNARQARERVWKVVYVDALVEGESRVFFGGTGLRRVGKRIYSADDSITLLHIATSGWHEIGQAGRLYRQRDVVRRYVPPKDTKNPR